MTTEEFKLNELQRQWLLGWARRVVEAVLHGRTAPVETPDDPVLCTPCGCFVTLHVNKELRGCIGTFQAGGPLYATVREMAQASLEDPRFTHRPLRAAELDRLEIEISVLSPLVRTADPLSLQLGKHGIYIRRGFMSGCFLPQVAEETGWSREEFLSYCCAHKAGLPSDAWKDPKTEVYLFTADVFGEKK